jgi:hypothetical protein
MKPLQHNQPKHRHTFAYVPGNVVTPPEIVKHLPPKRDQKVISTTTLCILLRRIVPQNAVSCLQDGIVINGNTVIISEGIATIRTMKFRFKDVWDLLMNLRQERMLDCDSADLKTIRLEYYQTLNEPDYE